MIAQFNNFSIKMTMKQAISASHPGACDDDVKMLRGTPSIYKQFHYIPTDKIIDELREYGAWSAEELSDPEANKERIIWIAACNIAEDHKK